MHAQPADFGFLSLAVVLLATAPVTAEPAPALIIQTPAAALATS